jgi:hypothetical protein
MKRVLLVSVPIESQDIAKRRPRLRNAGKLMKRSGSQVQSGVLWKAALMPAKPAALAACCGDDSGLLILRFQVACAQIGGGV